MIIFNRLGQLGRLGNQLFQVMATLSHAHAMGVPAAFNKWDYSDRFMNRVDDSLEEDVMRVNGRDHRIVNHLKFGYTPIPAGKNQCLYGFFQSDRYISQDLTVLKHLIPSNDLYKASRSKGGSFLNLMNTCSIHVRRGDYLEKQDYHPVQPIEYYLKAMRILEEKEGPCNYLVFSDDIAWCKAEFNQFNDKHIEFVDNSNEITNNDIVDLYLMSMCKHHIIANSSFSWWGSFLSRILDPAHSGTTIAPANWCGPKWKAGAKDDTFTDIYLPNWIVL